MVIEREASAPLASRASAGAVWLTLQNWVTRLSGFVTVAILARLLTPGEFGLVAIAMTVLSMVYLFADLGFTTYVVQATTLTPRTTTTTFWASTGLGLLLAGVLIVAAVPIAGFLGTPDAAAVIMAVAPAVAMVALAATPTALMRRGMRFRALSIQGAAAAVIGQVCALVLAFSGFGVWALIAQILVSQGMTLLLVWSTARWWPRGWPDRKLLPEIMGFGSKVVGVDFAAMARLWAENAAVTRVLGVAALGQFGIAQRLVFTVRDLMGSAIAPVSTVVFARVRGDSGRLAAGYGRSLALSFMVMAPALACVAVLAPILVPLLFGPQWTASILPAVALALAGIVGLSATLDHGLFYGLGKPGRWLVYAVVIETVQLAVTLVVVRYGLDAVAWGFVATSAVATVVRWFLVAALLELPVRRVVGLSIRPLLGVAVSIAVGALAAAVLDGVLGAPAFVVLLAVGPLVVLAHLLMARILVPAALADARSLLLSRFGRGSRMPTEVPE
ncbi:lipopolysaccharide biosynthesis protein [Microbacterium sp. cx-55]|uniref:lipopolysaccharide biosynthesis protein n=1 Tax=unclassified Microbacterium TaxID=2609290 RepID=UPI001CBDE49D|nr:MULTISPECIES: lipopolysaccharide biosynthesis protein [unclassified Microbacterium]MBZ4486901.1 lipopolysaccharide biosynthesis protein [Microbacterium sp. cx-55]MCC4908031.1 lipopolysaccharide biosynthesis protein [Microbacterium sp. cx-59]UGB35824.1 lipopolysaccharide biosynthesis protein [Microbacterium sp. cx-55]